MKLQARLYTRDGKKYFQTVATKGKEVIPFIYRVDIIFLGIGNDIERKSFEKINSKYYQISIDGFRGQNIFKKIPF